MEMDIFKNMLKNFDRLDPGTFTETLKFYTDRKNLRNPKDDVDTRYAAFSNFYALSKKPLFIVLGNSWPTSEHYFQVRLSWGRRAR
jgi:predicted NAD-dependent protein-ADP-ribosyltransferase YbiA (DUF1768 family)